ncbi:MAG: hypothetical protein NC826_06515, partial [Candidatus Omnitrophica bacterium]|nr:hypothetical protein [Candidatus Omnitrophota bacterium]
KGGKMKKIFILGVVLSLSMPLTVFSRDMDWQRISPYATSKVNDILIAEPYIYIATPQEIYRTKDRGRNWTLVFKAKDSIFLFKDKSGFLYAGTKDTLYFYNPQANHWVSLYRSRKQDNPLTSLAATEEGYLYLGTEKGVLISKDKGRTWQKMSSVLGHLRIIKIIYDFNFKIIYVLTERGVYRVKPDTEFYERLIIQTGGEENEGIESEIEKENPFDKIMDISIDRQGNLYIATKEGIMVSKDKANTFSFLADYGLLSRDISLIYIKERHLYVAGPKGIFLYQKDFWQNISLRLVVSEVYDIEEDDTGKIYVATDKGLFINNISQDSYSPESSEDIKDLLKDEPDIKEVQKRALAYAGIVEPKTIEKHRILARLKAILPTLNIDYDKTITYYSNTNFTRFAEGPIDWGISLTWNLSDLIWSEQQRLIDGQIRLLIELRNDLLEEVNKLYFERLRIKKEILEGKLSANQRMDKIIRLKELTAYLDGLTGGNFSSKNIKRYP